MLAACAFSVLGALVTIVVHLPINAQIAAWDPTQLPSDYRAHLDTWWRWHHVRLVTTVLAMSTVFLAVLLRDGRR